MQKKGVGATMANMVTVGTAIAFLQLDTSRYTNSLASARRQMETFRDSSADTSARMASLGQGMQTIGKSLTLGVTAPLVGVGAMVVKTGAQFESAMSEVQAISGATGTSFDDLKEKAREMGRDTKYSASESAEAFKYMAIGKWSVVEKSAA